MGSTGVEDVFNSEAVRRLANSLKNEAVAHGELECISMDATLRCCMPILGQASYRASAATRAAACVDDSESKRRVLTVRGRTSAVFGLWPVPEEDARSVHQAVVAGMPLDHRTKVKHLATDNPSPRLLAYMQRAFPNLKSLSLDPLHLAIVYEYATWRKRTPDSRMLRLILRKFVQFDSGYTGEPWREKATVHGGKARAA